MSITCTLFARAQQVLDGIDVDGRKQGGWFDARTEYLSAKAAYERDPNNSARYKRYADAHAEFERIDVKLDHWLDRINLLREAQSAFVDE
jgi:hypothetical protein